MSKTAENAEARMLPVLALRGLVIFPGMILQFDIGRKKSILAVKDALDGDRLVFAVAQVDLAEGEPTAENLYKVGVIAKIRQVVHTSEEGIKLHVEGICRAEISEVMTEEPYLSGRIVPCHETAFRQSYKTEALARIAQERFEEYIRWFRQVPSDILLGVMQQKDCGKLADFIAANISLDYEQKQCILDELHPVRRIMRLNEILNDEIQVMTLEHEISQKAQEQMDENQRNYMLREQMRAIANELGENDDPLEEADELRARINDTKMPDGAREKLLKECDRFAKMPYGSHEGSVMRVYIETCLELPWGKASAERLDLKRAERILDRDHFGLEKVKERFLETLAVRKLSDSASGQIICLVGPPGVGKTSIARSVAEATGRKYVRVSLGGIRDEADIMGHRRTYVGSMPGRIMAAVKQAGTNNPLILLDEIDKLGQSFKGDPSASLLEVLDPEQNSAFQDHYIDMPFDLSRVLFITTANDASQIPGPLYDRMDIITLGSYTHEEKYKIASKYLIPKQLKKNGVAASQLRFTPGALHAVIDNYTREAGVRTLERTVGSICRKAARRIVRDGDEFQPMTVRESDLEELLGPKKYSKESRNTRDEVGLVNGLAWTSVGGEMLPIEVAVMDGTGKIQLTGSLGDVMKESASAAITCIRSRAEKLGIPSDFYTKKDIHIHAPEGAVPKDGPSAGIAMATAVTSALLNAPIRHDLAMTGEITLQGRVLPIGGLREKAMAAYRNGIREVLIPEENVPDLAEVDESVKKNVCFLPVRKIDEVLPRAIPALEPSLREPAAPLLREQAHGARTLRQHRSGI